MKMLMLFFSASFAVTCGCDAFFKPKTSTYSTNFLQISNRFAILSIVDFKETGNCCWRESFSFFQGLSLGFPFVLSLGMPCSML